MLYLTLLAAATALEPAYWISYETSLRQQLSTLEPFPYPEFSAANSPKLMFPAAHDDYVQLCTLPTGVYRVEISSDQDPDVYHNLFLDDQATNWIISEKWHTSKFPRAQTLIMQSQMGNLNIEALRVEQKAYNSNAQRMSGFDSVEYRYMASNGLFKAQMFTPYCSLRDTQAVYLQAVDSRLWLGHNGRYTFKPEARLRFSRV